MKKNVAGQVVGAQMTTIADGSNFTGAVTVYVTGDAGTQAVGSVGAGACAHEGKGFHTYAPAQAETNYDHVGYTFEGTGAITVTVQERPTTALADLATLASYVDTEITDIRNRLPAALVSGRMDASVGAMASAVLTATAIASDALTAAKVAADVGTEFANTLLDAVNTGALHNIANSVGKQIRSAGGGTVSTIRSGTLQSGSTINTAKLDAGASATTNVYVGNVLSLTGGLGVGQTRTIIAYNGTTKIVTLSANWSTIPDNTTTFDIVASANSVILDEGVIQAATSTTATLAATASASNDIYNDGFISIVSGTGAGQTRQITDYVGSTKVATVDSAWSVNPDSASGYVIVPSGDQSSSAPADDSAVLAAIAATQALVENITWRQNTDLDGFAFFMRQSSNPGLGATGLSPTAEVWDGAAWTACANAPVEMDDGWYAIDLTAADSTAHAASRVIKLRFSAATALDTNRELILQPE